MTAQEWMILHFGAAVGDFTPMPCYMAECDFFLETFGPAVEDALRNGTSTYTAVMSVPGGTRGWEIYFEDWRLRGILG